MRSDARTLRASARSTRRAAASSAAVHALTGRSQVASTWPKRSIIAILLLVLFVVVEQRPERLELLLRELRLRREKMERRRRRPSEGPADEVGPRRAACIDAPERRRVLPDV